MSLKKIRVLIVDDSIFFRQALQVALQQDAMIEVIGLASNAFDARRQIDSLMPDVITLDVEMPGMTGPEFLKKLLPIHPIPVVLVSSLNINVFDALDDGAVDFVRKPDSKDPDIFERFCIQLSIKIKIASTAKIKKQVKLQDTSNLKLANISKRETIIAIGASTGGTEATLEILKQLPRETPPILVTQHMPPIFTKMYADRLNNLCMMSVKEAENGDRVNQGVVYIAQGDKQMTLERDNNGFYLKCADGEKVSGHKPSVDVLFSSVAAKAPKNSIGVILTGMGRDGADGLLKMRNAGAYTIGQDEQSCVVYGMPMEAFKLGAVKIQSPCSTIASKIIEKLNKW